MEISNQNVVAIISLMEKSIFTFDRLTGNEMDLLLEIVDNINERNLSILKSAYPKVFAQIKNEIH